MSAQRASKSTAAGNRQRTRTQRRKQARQQAKSQPQRKSLSAAQIVGGLITALVLVVIIVYAVIQSTGGSTAASNGPALTNPNDLTASGNVLPAGTKAPNFTLKGVNGKTYTLASQRGDRVVLEFFAVWCPHCQHEAPIMEKLAKTYQPKGVTMWMILANPYGPNYDTSGGFDTALATKKDVLNFGKLYGETLPKLINPNFSVVNKYDAASYPSIYVINSKGVITYSQAGDQPYGMLASAINSAK